MKCLKFILIAIFALYVPNITLADEQDDINQEIKQLEEQNKALESKLESKKAQKTSNTDKSGFLGFCKGQHYNTGCFIGLDIGVALSENYMFVDVTNLYPSSLTKNMVAVPINLNLGWQWYFTKNSGLRFKALVGYSNYSSNLGSFTNINVDPDYPEDATLKFSLNSNAIQYGLEAAYLFDFIYTEKHTFGADISVGFEGSSFFGQSLKRSGLADKISVDSYSKFTWTSSVGLHYFLNVHHQFFVAYKYRGYSNKSVNISDEGMTIGKISSTPSHTFVLSYAYKF